MSEIVYRKLTDIKKLPNNPRTIKKDDMERLKKSIKDNPDYFEARPIILSNRTGDLVILAGNQRYEAAKALKMDEVPTFLLEGLTEAREREIIIRDNVSNGEWDMDLLANEWDEQELDDWGVKLDWKNDKIFDEDYGVSGSMQDKYGVPPFSVLDTRQGNWQERRREWLALGIESEKGRDEGLLGSSNMVAQLNEGTSVFDPFLCEIMYKWFCPIKGSVIDPFAGGSVRGIVAAKTGHSYLGLELRPEQVAANIEQRDKIIGDIPESLNWIIGDSNKTLDTINEQFDIIFSCPPYADLEIYSDDPNDLSNMEYDDFIKAYRSIIKKTASKLKDNRFAIFVVGEVRGKDGSYRNFVSDTIQAFVDAGLIYYNEIILINSAGTLPLRAGRVFNSSRKIGKMHQNILVFYKGDIGKIKEEFGEIKIEKDIDK